MQLRRVSRQSQAGADWARRPQTRLAALPQQRTGRRPREAYPGRRYLRVMGTFVYFYVLVLLPLMGGDGKPRIENMLFWPLVATSVLALMFVNSSRVDKGFFLSAPVLSFGAYLLLAVLSITWALAPEFAFNRCVLQVLCVIIILMPYALPDSEGDTFKGLHLASLVGVAIHAYFILTTPGTPIGHPGYYTHKQELGMFCGAALILAAHELLLPGWRRWLAVVSLSLAIWVIIASQSKSALAFPFVAGAFGLFACIVCRWLKTTPAYIVAAVVVGFEALSRVWSDPIGRIAFLLYGDPTLTGRTHIWDWINYQIIQRSWLGGGFHSYWSVPNSPHGMAPGFVQDMVSTHSGYLELKLDTGFIGYWIFLMFIYASLHYLGPIVRKDLIRGWLLVSLTAYILLLNLLESVWLNTGPLWIIYLVIVGESVRAARSDNAVSAAGGAGKKLAASVPGWSKLKRGAVIRP